jgi:hypothetical protein
MDTPARRFGALLLVAMYCCLLAAADNSYARADELAGKPATEMVDRYVELCGWLTDVDYTPAQRAELRAQVHAYWRDGDRDAQRVVISSLTMWQQLRDAPPDVRAATLAQTRPAVLVELQKDAAAGGAHSRWLYEQFLRAHPPLAHGHPDSVPLTRDMVDASLDWEHFMTSTVLNRPASPPTPETRRAAYSAAARAYAGLTTAQQLELAQKSGRLALERGQWERMDPPLRAFVRSQLGGNLTLVDQQALAQLRQLQSGGGSMALLQSQLDHMKQSSDIIMGRGTTWNGTLGRWEQQGGIVTEYGSGVTRVP